MAKSLLLLIFDSCLIITEAAFHHYLASYLKNVSLPEKRVIGARCYIQTSKKKLFRLLLGVDFRSALFGKWMIETHNENKSSSITGDGKLIAKKVC